MILKVPAQLLRGFCMGAADVVPGVSGGTVALVFGIYETLVTQVKDGARAGLRLLRLDVRGFVDGLKALDWMFLVPLLAGVGLAVVTLASTIEHLLEERPEDTAAAFFGLVVASIVVAWGYVRRWDNGRVLVMLGTTVFTFWFLGLRAGTVADAEWWMIMGAGALAICAMILPGISGSFILLMLGMYDFVLESISDRDLAVVAVFGVGCVVGLASFSSLLDWLLRNHHDTVVAALVGLMAGSLRVLWPWPEGVESARLHAPPSGDWLGPVVIAVVAAVVVLGVAGLGARSERARAHAR